MLSLPPERHAVHQVRIMSALLDGVYDGDQTISEVLRHERIPFAVITRFVAHARRDVPTRATRAEIVELLAGVVPSQNYLYAVRIRGRFILVRTRTVARQSPALPMTAAFAGAHLDPADLDAQIERSERHS